MPICKSCGAPVTWRQTKAGRPMICNQGTRTIITEAGDVVRGLEPHWATCPTAEEHRKARKAAASKGEKDDT